jgi:hypothetical protein
MLVVNRSCPKYGFDIAKDALNLPQLFVFQCHFVCCKIRIGRQHPLAVKARF